MDESASYFANRMIGKKISHRLIRGLVKPKEFLDIEKTPVQRLKRGVGVAYYLINRPHSQPSGLKLTGVVMRRRKQSLLVKYGNEIHWVFILAYRKDWSEYRQKIASRYLKILIKKLAAAREAVKKVAELAYKNRHSGISQTSFNMELRELTTANNLNKEEADLVRKYFDVLQQAKPNYFQEYDGT